MAGTEGAALTEQAWSSRRGGLPRVVEMTFPQLVRLWYDVRPVVHQVVGSYSRAEAVLLGMKLQAYHGECFASSRYLGGGGHLSAKAVQRVLAQLDRRALIQRGRVARGPEARTRSGKSLAGTLGTYRIDWRKLWELCMGVLRAWRRERVRLGLLSDSWMDTLGYFRAWFPGLDAWLWDPGGG